VITSEQIKAARSMLRITVAELSSLSGVGIATIKRIEAHSGVPPANVRTLELITRALLNAGIEFVGASDDKPGVRLSFPSKD
jgi:transcriptional regulator with XRE-family HTH domain